MVLAFNLSAMFDPLRMDAPESFHTDRPWGDYILWGYGMHTCFGAYINRAVMPEILKPLLAKPGSRRAPPRARGFRAKTRQRCLETPGLPRGAGAAGRIDGGGTPFPQHFSVEWD